MYVDKVHGGSKLPPRMHRPLLTKGENYKATLALFIVL